MKKISIQKVTLLGLLLVTTSVIAAAVFPSKPNSDSNYAPDGTMTTSSTPNDGFGKFTCAPRNDGAVNTCDQSFFSGTTNGFIATEGYTTSFVS